jgi:hypothetical protein
MEFVLLIVSEKGVPAREAVAIEDMGRFAGELARAGKLRGGAPLYPDAAGKRVSASGGRFSLVDGPFAESKEVIGGYFLVEAESRAEAVEMAKRCPHARAGVVELRPLPDRDADGSDGWPRFMFLLFSEPGLTDPDGSKYREMLAYDRALKAEGCYVESSQLGSDPLPARVELRAGLALVVDGPFAETKEVAGGYYVVAAPSLDAAVEIAKRCPCTRWGGTIEVREVLKVPPPVV